MIRRAVLYLHGFASSPQSSKARYFSERAREAGLPFTCPDLNFPEFSTLTVTRMLDQVDAAIDAMPAGPVALVGSSLGGFVAVHAAARRAGRAGNPHPVDRLVLLAPAFDIVCGLEAEFGPVRMAEWERRGQLDVFHYGDNRMRQLDWGFMADARVYAPFGGDDRTPTLVFQGRGDEVVECAMVERYAASRPWVSLTVVDDGHQLLEHRDGIWRDTTRFIEADV